MKYYTIFLGDKMWEDVIDDMNTTSSWCIGGMVWKSKKKAEQCMKNLQKPVYEFETKQKKFKVVTLSCIN